MNEQEEKRSFITIISRNKHTILAIIMMIGIIISVIVYNRYLSVKTTYTVTNGYVEKVTDSLGYVIKDEVTVEINSKEVAMPIVEQNKRVAKDETIAVYKNGKYEEYLNSIQELDETIQGLIKDLPVSYSNDVANLDAQITSLAKEAQNETSYIKMQEYKTKIDELAYKKVIILGERSPEGSKIRELIAKREEIEKNSMASADNIVSPISGIVTYKLDGLEKIVDFNQLFQYDITKYEMIISQYKGNNLSNFGIKVVDNYKSYLLVKEPKGEHDQYIKEGQEYELKFTDKEDNNVTAKLLKVTDTEEYHYIIFQLENGIEYITDLRTVNVEIVWNKTQGIAVPKNAIQRNEEKRISICDISLWFTVY